VLAVAILAVPHEVPGFVVPGSPGAMHSMKAIEVGTEMIDVVASETTGDERERLFRTQAERSELGHRLFRIRARARTPHSGDRPDAALAATDSPPQP
jgi:hypothetical protein